MVSFLIECSESQDGITTAQSLCTEKDIAKIDITIIELGKKNPNSQSIGVEDIKQIQQKVFFKPLQSKEKAIVIQNAELLTIPAQNALLKLLEEPPPQTILYLITINIDALLPTIQSRCQTISVKKQSYDMSGEERKEAENFLQTFQKPLPELLKEAEILAKQKDQTLRQMQNAVHILRKDLLTSLQEDQPSLDSITLIKQIEEARNVLLRTNTQPRLVLEHLFLSTR